MSDNSDDKGSLFWGLLLVAIGVLFLFDNLRILDFGDIIRDFWPLILIAIGLKIIWKAKQEKEQAQQPAEVKNSD